MATTSTGGGSTAVWSDRLADKRALSALDLVNLKGVNILYQNHIIGKILRSKA